MGSQSEMVSASFSRLAFAHFMGKFPLCLVFASFFRPRMHFHSLSPRFRLALAAISPSRCMGKQSEAPKIGEVENRHLREEVSHSRTPRTSDSAYVRFLTEIAMLSRRNLHCGDIWSEFLTQRIMRYRRFPQVWVREWNLWALSRAPLPAK